MATATVCRGDRHAPVLYYGIADAKIGLATAVA